MRTHTHTLTGTRAHTYTPPRLEGRLKTDSSVSCSVTQQASLVPNLTSSFSLDTFSGPELLSHSPTASSQGQKDLLESSSFQWATLSLPRTATHCSALWAKRNRRSPSHGSPPSPNLRTASWPTTHLSPRLCIPGSPHSSLREEAFRLSTKDSPGCRHAQSSAQFSWFCLMRAGWRRSVTTIVLDIVPRTLLTAPSRCPVSLWIHKALAVS